MRNADERLARITLGVELRDRGGCDVFLHVREARREDAARERGADGYEVEREAFGTRVAERLQDLGQVLVLERFVRSQVRRADGVVRSCAWRDAASRRARDADDLDLTREHARLREGEQRELYGRRKAAWGCHVARLLDRVAIELGQAVHERALLELLGARVLAAVVLLVGRHVAQSKVAGHVDHTCARRHELTHHGRAHLVREAEHHDVDLLRGFCGRKTFERELRLPLEAQVNGRQRLADMVDRRHPNELDVGMVQETPDHLAAAVPAPSDHCRPQLCHVGLVTELVD